MDWLLAYCVGAFLMLVLCGATISKEPTPGKIVGSMFVAALWPVILPIMLGAILREMI